MIKGISDLGGVGKLAGECRKFVMDLLRHHAGRKERELKNVEQELKNDALRLRNQGTLLKNQAAAFKFAQEVFATAKRRGWTAEEVEQLLTFMNSPKQLPTTKPKPDGPGSYHDC
jgi:hypothetical protein